MTKIILLDKNTNYQIDVKNMKLCDYKPIALSLDMQWRTTCREQQGDLNFYNFS